MVDPKIRSAWSELNAMRKFGTKKALGSVYVVRQMCQIFWQLFLHSDKRCSLASDVHLSGRTGFRRKKAEMVSCLKMGGPTYKVEKAKGNQVISQKMPSG